MSAYSVNCETTSAAPADVDERPIGPALVVAEDAQLGGLARELVGDRLRVVRADAQQDDQSRPDRADDLAVDADRRPGRALEERPHGWPGGGITPCSATKASRHASASRSYAVAGRRVALAHERLGRGRDEQVVVADAVGVHLAVAAEHDDGHAAGLDLVHERRVREVLAAAR